MKKIKEALQQVANKNLMIKLAAQCGDTEGVIRFAEEQQSWLKRYNIYVRNDHDQFAALYDEFVGYDDESSEMTVEQWEYLKGQSN